MIHTSDSHGAYQSLLGLVFAGWYVAVLSNLTDFEPFLVVPTLTPLVGINACRVVHMPEDYVRQVNPRYATKEQDQVAFSDGYPFLLVNEASLADLSARMQESLPVNRFRPNIVVKGMQPYVEDMWRKIYIGHVAFHIVKASERCPITTTNQTTAVVGKEPLKTLATYRRAQKGIIFGQNLVHEHEGIIRLGDTVEVVEKAAMPNFTPRVKDSGTNRTEQCD